jgi:hypothetical protein
MKVAEEKGVDKDHLVDFIDVSFLSILSWVIPDASLDWRNCLYARQS